jgi:hypothetical protein
MDVIALIKKRTNDPDPPLLIQAKALPPNTKDPAKYIIENFKYFCMTINPSHIY